ncbi:MAG: replicative DNA helicase [candidate division NC10 bacterium]|nr:replicative DNA helicase [candidate division NC10 bacterium]
MAGQLRDRRTGTLDQAQERIPPQALEAEVAVLGAILQDREALLKALEILKPEHFYREAHRKIYAASIGLFDRGEPVDLVTLSNELTRRKELEEVGGASFLTQLLDVVPTAANVSYHARIVRDKAVLRDLIRVATDLVGAGYAEREDVDELLDLAERRVFEISQDRISRAFTPLKHVLKGTFELIERLHGRKSLVTGIPTGFRKFDEMTAGLQPSDFVVIAGRPSMGKTSFSLGVAQHAAIVERLPVAIFSLEMSMEQVALRMLCSEARVDSNKVRTGYLSGEKDWRPLIDAASRLSEAPIFIDDTPGNTVLEMRAKARRLKAEQNLQLVIIDYLQLLQGRGRAENRQQEIAEICRGLKAMAKELNVPVVALSQLSRRAEEREEGRPQLADLRESGAIEQDADLVAFLYRPSIYKRKDPSAADDRTTEIIIAKQRNGPTGTVKLTFFREYTRFEPLEEVYGEPA